MDRLMALRAFSRVVELGGFTNAADSLQLSKTSVSDLVQSLEKHLGVRLLQRTTRRVTATAEGAAFYERCTHILADLDEAEASYASICPVGLPDYSSFHGWRRSLPAIPICDWSWEWGSGPCIC